MKGGQKAKGRVRTLTVITVLLCSFLFAFLLDLLPWFGQLERATYDAVFAIRQTRKPAPEVVVIAMDETSLQEIGPMPWPRTVHALLLQKLGGGGAKIVVFDVIFDAARDPDEDRAFAQAIANFTRDGGKVILGKDVSDTADPQFSLEQVIEPLPLFTEAGAIGAFVTTPRDSDYKIRRANWLVKGSTTLATEAYHQLTGEQLRQEGNRLYLGKRQVPADAPQEQPTFSINFVGPSGTIPKRSYYQAIEGTLPPDFLKGKVVFVGADLAAENRSGRSVTDRFPTPADSEGVLMPGVEIHANAFNTVVTGSFVRIASPLLRFMALLLFAALTTLYCTLLRPLHAGFATASTVLASASAVYFIFVQYNVWLPSVRPTVLIALIYVGNTVAQYRTALRERAQISRAFKHYVSAEVLGELMKNPENLELGGREVEATVLFTDIAGFSKISEKITPQELTQMLNQYFELLAGVIMKEGGMVNKFIGDAVMALWGVPLDNPSHASQACLASLQIHRAMLAMAPVTCRIGLNTGRMIAGNLGSRERFEYTVIGDAVNLASRLEGVNKLYHTDVMISEMTEEKVRGQFLLREVDCIRVVGKEEPVRIFQLLDSMDDRDSPEHMRWSEMIESFIPSHEKYQRREWDSATRLFEKHFLLFPEDPLGRIYLERSRAFLSQPPPNNWDGVYQMESK